MLGLNDIQWNLDALRLTLFTKDKISAVDKKWIYEVTKKEPEVILKNERGEQYTEVASLDDFKAKLDMTCRTNRIDWRMIFDDKDKYKNDQIHENSIGFLTLINPWLKGFEMEIVRVAIGVEVSCPVENSVNSINILKKYVPFFNINESSYNDIDLKVSRKSILNNFDDIIVNQSAIISATKQIKMRLNENSPIPIPEAYISDACVLQLDINTNNENKKTLGDISAIVGELMLIAYSMLKEGLKND